MATESTGNPKVVLGCMEFGRFKSNEEVSNRICAEFARRGFNELDTALMYTQGTSETFIGRMDLFQNGTLKVATKFNPFGDCSLSSAGIKSQKDISFGRLQTEKVDLLYLHAPDHSVPIEETLAAMNELYQQGCFERLGLSNFSAWQVADIVGICRANGYPQPTVYQGMYNGLTRDVEPELFPCLRRFGIGFYAYNPLAGGVLTGKHSYEQAEANSIQEGRFGGEAKWAVAYRNRYWKKEYFDSVDLIKNAVSESYPDGSVSLVDASLRWMMYHSAMGGHPEDAVILGAGTYDHFVQNVDACVSGPLDQRVVDAFDQGWELCKGNVIKYFR